MTRLLTILAVVGILAVALWLPVQAGMVAVDDSVLAGISGKNNTSGVGVLTQSADTSANGNVQVGYYQWDDNHNLDGTAQKAANFFTSEGGSNQAQQNVTAVINEINWGAAANSATNVGTISSGSIQGVGDIATGVVDIETWGTLYIGGF